METNSHTYTYYKIRINRALTTISLQTDMSKVIFSWYLAREYLGTSSVGRTSSKITVGLYTLLTTCKDLLILGGLDKQLRSHGCISVFTSLFLLGHRYSLAPGLRALFVQRKSLNTASRASRAHDLLAALASVCYQQFVRKTVLPQGAGNVVLRQDT